MIFGKKLMNSFTICPQMYFGMVVHVAFLHCAAIGLTPL